MKRLNVDWMISPRIEGFVEADARADWIPAFAGMTSMGRRGDERKRGGKKGDGGNKVGGNKVSIQAVVRITPKAIPRLGPA